MGKEIYQKCRRGVFTTEASVIVPMVVIMMALLLMFTFYVGNRNWYSCAAYEAALKGNGALETEKGSRKAAAEESAAARIKDQVLPGGGPSSEVSSGSTGTTVSFEGQLYDIFQGMIPRLEVTKKVDRINPENLLRLRWIKENTNK